MDNKRIRPSRQTKTHAPDSELETVIPTDSKEQNRVMESLSISVPAVNVPRPNPALATYRNQRVRLLLKDGAVINGTLSGTQWDFLRLEGIEEIGKDYKLNADWCAVKSDSVVRVYPGNAQVEEISKA